MKKRRAFTLIELLVVISILTLLIAIILPSLRSARADAKRAACASNLHQVGVALQGYLSANRDRLPKASFLPSLGPGPLPGPEPVYIADVLARYLDAEMEVFHCPSDVSGRPPRDPPNTGLSFFESERSSYEYRVQGGGYTVLEAVNMVKQLMGRTVADNTIWIMRDYGNFHAEGGKLGARRYLYSDGHVADFENF